MCRRRTPRSGDWRASGCREGRASPGTRSCRGTHSPSPDRGGEIHDVDGIHLAYLLIVLAYVDVVGDDLRHAIEDAVEVSQLTVVLNIEDGELALLVLGKDVHTVELVVFVFLIGLALKEAHDGELLVQQRSHQSFEHGMVCLVAQQAFHRPIKANQICNFRLIFNVLLILLLEIYSFP